MIQIEEWTESFEKTLKFPGLLGKIIQSIKFKRMPEKHHMHQFNPDWQTAARHGRANQTGIVDRNRSLTKIEDSEFYCTCCGEHLQKEPISLSVHSKELQFLGFGFPLFYEFLKYCIVLLIVHIGCYHAISLEQAVENNYQFCHGKTHQEISEVTEEIAYKCYTFLIELARIEDEQTSEQLTIRSVAFGIHLLALLYIRNVILKLQAYYDERSTTLSDYSLLLDGICKPEGKVRRSIMTFLGRQVTPEIPAVEQILILPHFQKIEELTKARKKLLHQIRPYYSKQLTQQQQKTLDDLKTKLARANAQITQTAQNDLNDIKEDKINCERAILVFDTEQDKQNVFNSIKRADKALLKKYFGENSRVSVEQAPDPEQILWENFNIPVKKRVIMMIIGWTLSLVTLTAVFIGFYFILVAKSDLLQKAVENLAENPDEGDIKSGYAGAVALVFIMMFLVVLFDKIILATLFHKFTEIQMPRTTAKLQFSFALKLALGLFFTTALMTLATEAIKMQNYYTHPYGVIDEETIMFFMNAFFIPFFWLVNPFSIFKAIKRKCMKGRKDMTQHEANKLMEEESYDLGKRFAEIIETMWFVFFYATLLPIGAVISVCGLSFYYWVDKFNLLRRSKVHGKVSGSFMKTSLLLLDFTLILRPVGSIIFDLHLRGKAYQTSNIIFICIAFVYIILPKNYMINLINPEDFRLEQKTYTQVKEQFRHNYHTNHPLFHILDDDEVSMTKKVDRDIYNTWAGPGVVEKGGSLDSNVGLIL